jgi:phosphoribosylanthranilate isomerase
MRRPVIKSFGVDASFDDTALDPYPPGVTVLLDARDDEKRGGTGRRIDWTVAARIAARRRVMLAGGVDAGNVEEAIRAVRPFAIDVSSGVERAPGLKDRAKMQALFEAVKRC